MKLTGDNLSIETISVEQTNLTNTRTIYGETHATSVHTFAEQRLNGLMTTRREIPRITDVAQLCKLERHHGVWMTRIASQKGSSFGYENGMAGSASGGTGPSSGGAGPNSDSLMENYPTFR